MLYNCKGIGTTWHLLSCDAFNLNSWFYCFFFVCFFFNFLALGGGGGGVYHPEFRFFFDSSFFVLEPISTKFGNISKQLNLELGEK